MNNINSKKLSYKKIFDLKYFITGSLIAIVLIWTTISFAASIDVIFNDVKIYIQKKGQEPQYIKADNFLFQGVTYVPLRTFAGYSIMRFIGYLN